MNFGDFFNFGTADKEFWACVSITSTYISIICKCAGGE